MLLNGLTFAICFAIAGVSAAFHHRNDPISLCEISAHPETFAGKVVRVRALISRDVVVSAPADIDSLEVSAFAACTGKEEWARAYVTLDKESRLALPPNTAVWNDRDSPADFYLSEGVIVGRFEPHEDGITRCFTPRYELAEASLESLAAITTVSRERTAEWVKLKSQ